MDDNPTTDDVTTSLPSAPVEPERIGSVMLPQKVSKLRRKLGQKAKQEPRFRFYTLYDRIYRLDVLITAWQIVVQNDGAPGVDGVSCRDIIDGPGGLALVQELHEELRTKRYQPQPVKRTYVPKPDGRPRSNTADTSPAGNASRGSHLSVAGEYLPALVRGFLPQTRWPWDLGQGRDYPLCGRLCDLGSLSGATVAGVDREDSGKSPSVDDQS